MEENIEQLIADNRALAEQNMTLKARVAELEAALTAADEVLNEGQASGMVPFAQCKRVYAQVCKTLHIEPRP